MEYSLCANHKFNPTTQLHGRNSEHFNSSCGLCKLERAIIELRDLKQLCLLTKCLGNVRVNQCCLQPKSLERSPAVGDFYGTRIEIWAGFGPVRQLLRPFFFTFSWSKNFFKNILDGENIFGIE